MDLPTENLSFFDRQLARCWGGYSAVALFAGLFVAGCGAVAEELLPQVSYLLLVIAIGLGIVCLGTFALAVLQFIFLKVTRRQIQRESEVPYTKMASRIFLFGAICVGGLLVYTNRRSQQPKALQPDTWTTHQLGDGSLLIDLPTSFELDNTVNIRDGFGMTDSARGLNVIISATHKMDLKANSLEQFAESTMQRLQQEVSEGTVSPIESVPDGHHKALRLTFEGHESNVRYVCVVDFIELGDWLVDLRFLTTPSRLEAWGREARRIEASLRVEKSK